MIDFVIVSSDLRPYVLDTRVKRGAKQSTDRLINIAWKSAAVPKEWQTEVVVPLFKKGDQTVCASYRGIKLLNLPGKVYSKVLERRVHPIVKSQIEEELCGFRPGRGLAFYSRKDPRGGLGVSLSSLHVFCGFGEGV